MSETESLNTIYQGNDELRDQIRAVMSNNKRLSQAILSKEAGISATTFNQWINSKYLGDNEGVEQKIRIWLEADNNRRAAGNQMPEAPSFVSTPTAARILGALGYAQMAGDIAVIHGGPGVGKTEANKFYRDSSPNVWIATMDPSTAGVVTALQAICDALGLAPGGGAWQMSRAICKRVRDTHGLLIVDEAQHLSIQALEQIRSIHDSTGIAIAFVGNDGVFARMAGGRNEQQLDRLRSRVGKRLSLKRPTETDVTTLLKAWSIEDTKCRSTLLKIADSSGALRLLTKVLRLASMYAKAEGRPVCCEDVRAAASELTEGSR